MMEPGAGELSPELDTGVILSRGMGGEPEGAEGGTAANLDRSRPAP